MTPALIDCHTHVVFGGNRAREFEMRLNGASYEEIARAGGGIVSTVRATRAADEAALLAGALPRVDALIAEGVATVEIKSGYGLDRETELRMLRVAREIGRVRPVRVRTTLPRGACGAGGDRTPTPISTTVCIPTLHAAHAEGLVDAVDAFCEGIAFSPAQVARVFAAARALGLPVKIHAEQLSEPRRRARWRRGSAGCRPTIWSISTPMGVAAMAAAGTVAVILPGAFYTLRETQAAAGRGAARAQGCRWRWRPTAIPGSSPMTSILLAMNMACTLFRLTPEEALAGATRDAARALGLDDCGRDRAGAARRPRDLGRRSTRRSSPTASASTRCHERIFGGGAMILTPGAVTLAELEAVWRGGARRRSTPPRAPAIEAAAARVAAAAAGGAPVYGVNTGFGKLASVKIPAEDTAPLQRNLILSHCAGVGERDAGGGGAADDGAEARLARARRLGRALGAGRAARGDAGRGRDAGGAGRRARSAPRGDLAPLAHMAAVMLGEGEAEVGGARAARRRGAGGRGPRADRAGGEGGAGAHQRHAVLHRLGAGRAVRRLAGGAERAPRSRRCRPTRSWARPRRSGRRSTRCAAIAGRSRRRR